MKKVGIFSLDEYKFITISLTYRREIYETVYRHGKY